MYSAKRYSFFGIWGTAAFDFSNCAVLRLKTGDLFETELRVEHVAGLLKGILGPRGQMQFE